MTEAYGSWPSIISASDVAAAGVRLDSARFVGDDVWWGQSVPEEGGRSSVFSQNRGASLLPAPWNARSRVHEYGGGSWTATPDGTLIFVEASDQRVWALKADTDEPIALTPDTDGTVRHGGLTVSGGKLLAITEHETGAKVPVRSIISISLTPTDDDLAAGIETLATGADFYAHPALSPDGENLAWIEWNHPNMPWDHADVRVKSLASDSEPTTLSSASGLQPVWDGDRVVFADDPAGRWNLFEAHGTHISPIAPADADTGGGVWVLGQRWFAVGERGIVATRINGQDSVLFIDRDGQETALNVPAVTDVSIDDIDGSRVLITGSPATTTPAVWIVDLDNPTAPAQTVVGGTSPWDESWISVAEPRTFNGAHGDVHAFSYAPKNPEVHNAETGPAPYIVTVHGGPTAHGGGGFSPLVTYFTSRGIGVLDVNYSGSTGYGREYRERLLGQWGVADVADVIAAAQGLVDDGSADSAKIAIKGGSAGGWTVLSALVASGVFSAGISRYGVADLRMLAAETHDFEARYLDGLVGPLPEEEQLYIDRSPLTHVDQISAPVLLLQGSEDPVVPPSQSEAIRDGLRERGVPHAYVLFEGESHGFRRSETIIEAVETELRFLSAVFGFTPADLKPLDLD